MPQTYIWMHEDALGRHHPVFEAISSESCSAEADGPIRPRVIFIWDKSYFEAQAYSLKRLTFIYECLIDVQRDTFEVEIYQGDTANILREIITDAGEGAVLRMADTPNVTFLKIVESLRQDFPVEIIKDTPFIEPPDDVDMTRFFRFWNRSRRSAFGFKAQT